VHEGYESGASRQGAWRRAREVEIIERYRQSFAGEHGGVAELAREVGVPESTLRHWRARAEATEAHPDVVAFFESPAGLAVLHRIVVAATYVLTQVVGGGVRSVCTFLELSGLNCFVASSFGTQQAAVVRMEDVLVEFGDVEQPRLASEMRPRDITLALDETFHCGRTCFVAIEPVSNYILAEEYADDRRAETWEAVMARKLAGLTVEVIQVTSDEGSALRKYACELLGVHHSPDLFHPHQDLSRATSVALQRDIRAAHEATERARRGVDAVRAEAQAYQAQRRGPGRPLDYSKRIKEADVALAEAEKHEAEVRARYERVRDAARGISTAYHPFDLDTGATRGDYQVKRDIEARFATIDEVAAEVELSERRRKLIDKARRLIPQMATTIALIHSLIAAKVAAARLSRRVKNVVRTALIPALYLEIVARKAKPAARRAELRERAATLREVADAPRGPLAMLSPELRADVEALALDCANLFQRSDSCVEGRNGVLALKHHSLHDLSPRKLHALTVVHNFATQRTDGTTPAERFFGQRHANLFEYLVERLPPPPRPAAQRRTLH